MWFPCATLVSHIDTSKVMGSLRGVRGPQGQRGAELGILAALYPLSPAHTQRYVQLPSEAVILLILLHGEPQLSLV